jgi:CRP/FNR family cyclic AMP-dependent transcriptional regulator
VSAFDDSSRHPTFLLDQDPDLGEAVPARDRALARRVLVADVCELSRGPWVPELAGPEGRFPLMITSGLVMREVLLAGRRAAQVFGPRDVLRAGAFDDSSLSEVVEWTVMHHAVVATLDDGFRSAARRWPMLAGLHLAIAQLPRIEQRLLGMLWHLADRFGHVSGAGAVVPFALTHEQLGRLVGARRPTVSLGLAALDDLGYVTRRHDGFWLLNLDSRAMLAPDLSAGDGHVAVDGRRLQLVRDAAG